MDMLKFPMFSHQEKQMSQEITEVVL
jgi:hypothetical protein